MLVNNLEIDPSSPPFWQPVSQPPSFSAELAEWIQEPYETTGWSCMTNAMKDEEVDAQTFLEDIEFTMGWREKLTYAALERDDWGLLFSVFSTTDRVQHIMYKHYDAAHPQHKADEASKMVTFFGKEIPLKQVIPEIYRQMDRVVGRVLDDFVGADDTLMLCADHGFTSYRRGMHVNNWLAQEGYLVMRDGVQRSAGRSLAAYPDWSKTKAYSLGLGMVFLNLEGREPHGIVKLEDADEVLGAIAADFIAATDTGEDGKVDGEIYVNPAYAGTKVGHDAVIMKDLYAGPWGTEEYLCADLMLGFEENYRASWSTVTGRIKLERDGSLGATYENNTNPWSGDHASVSPHVVTGIFFSNRAVEVPEDGVSVLHMAPTILSRLGLDVPEGMASEPLSFGQ
jgi:predicted AlkP superfamily phosphohydrolase/phosphomutase